MNDSVFSIDVLNDLVRRMPPARPLRHRVIVSEYLTETVPRELSTLERIRVWLENLTDRADLNYPWSRVRRTETRPRNDFIVMGDTIFCHPIVADRARRSGMGVIGG